MEQVWLALIEVVGGLIFSVAVGLIAAERWN